MSDIYTHLAAMSKIASTSQRHAGCKSKAHFFQNKFDIFTKPTCQLLFFGNRYEHFNLSINYDH